ncbi:MAG: hypothetical protein ACLQIB_57005 [Isosphaeraceae bacterium]
MRTFDPIAILIVMAAVFSYMNLKVLKLPAAIGLMARGPGVVGAEGAHGNRSARA